jgi:hypothetical protein
MLGIAPYKKCFFSGALGCESPIVPEAFGIHYFADGKSGGTASRSFSYTFYAFSVTIYKS